MSKWTAVPDPATLKAGDHIQVRFHKGAIVEDTLMNDVSELDSVGYYWFFLQSVDEFEFAGEDATVFVASAPFTLRNNPLEPGEVVEDEKGDRYVANPLDNSRIIGRLSGYEWAQYTHPVRAVR